MANYSKYYQLILSDVGDISSFFEYTYSGGGFSPVDLGVSHALAVELFNCFSFDGDLSEYNLIAFGSNVFVDLSVAYVDISSPLPIFHDSVNNPIGVIWEDPFFFRNQTEYDYTVANGSTDSLFTHDFYPPSSSVDLTSVLDGIGSLNTKVDLLTASLSNITVALDVMNVRIGAIEYVPYDDVLLIAKIEDVYSNIVGIRNNDLFNGFNGVNDAINAISPDIDFTPVLTSLNQIKDYTDSVETQLLIIDNKVSATSGSIVGQSLNGIGCEFKDGVSVTVEGRITEYTVLRSFFFLLDDSSYTVLYDLTSPTGETLYAPESLLTRYSTTVTAP